MCKSAHSVQICALQGSAVNVSLCSRRQISQKIIVEWFDLSDARGLARGPEEEHGGSSSPFWWGGYTSAETTPNPQSISPL